MGGVSMSIGRRDIRRIYNQKGEVIFCSNYSWAYNLRSNWEMRTDIGQFDDKHKAMIFFTTHDRAGLFR